MVIVTLSTDAKNAWRLWLRCALLFPVASLALPITLWSACNGSPEAAWDTVLFSALAILALIVGLSPTIGAIAIWPWLAPRLPRLEETWVGLIASSFLVFVVQSVASFAAAIGVFSNGGHADTGIGGVIVILMGLPIVFMGRVYGVSASSPSFSSPQARCATPMKTAA